MHVPKMPLAIAAFFLGKSDEIGTKRRLAAVGPGNGPLSAIGHRRRSILLFWQLGMMSTFFNFWDTV
jgi:hypothetical protein